MALKFVVLAGALVSQGWAFPQSASSSTSTASKPASTACGDLIRAATIDNPYGVVNASQVYDCWSTVPFNAAVATRYIQYWNTTLQFQSSLDWLKRPPSGYQKPAADLIAGLQQIQDTISSGGYNGEYEFEAALQRLLYSANDNHVFLSAGLLSSFSFANPFGITSLSLDGIALPKVYLTDDLYWNQSRTSQDTWQPSALSQINGQDATEYLSEFASLNSKGTLGPSTDWNTLMDNPVADILLYFNMWQGAATFYPGATFTFTFENGSTSTGNWVAVYNNQGDTGPLETGGDFYNAFVLGFYPASYDPDAVPPSNDTYTPPPPATSWADYSPAFPNDPNIVQPNLANTGYLTGYFLPQSSLAVLSLPTFSMDGNDIQTFSDTVQDFLTQSKAQGMQKVLIDLQQNQGGDIILAYNTFRQFFPSVEPFAGSKRRDHPLANTMGTAITTYWNNLTTTDSEYANFSSDEWIATDRLNANTGRNFSSWAELYGPENDRVGEFSLTERWNTSSFVFDYSALGEVNPPSPIFGSAQAAPYAASDIIMLTDSLCSSTCSLLMEMMRHDAGVQTVVIGGRPKYGPMQAPGQSRGARFYSLDELNTDIYNTAIINETAVVPNRTEEQSIWTLAGGISLREQVRKDDPVPLSMKFEAADCRIFWTPDTWNNMTNLWQYAAAAIWTDPSKCVRDSTGYASTSNDTRAVPPYSVPAGVHYDANGVIMTQNASKSIHVTAPGEPAPDAPLPPIHPVPRRGNQPTTPQSNSPTYVNGNQSPYYQQTTNGNNAPKTNDCFFISFSSNRPSPYCLTRRRKRSLFLSKR